MSLSFPTTKEGETDAAQPTCGRRLTLLFLLYRGEEGGVWWAVCIADSNRRAVKRGSSAESVLRPAAARLERAA